MKSLNSSGQTLVALLIFIMLTIAITTTAAAITIVNTQGNNSLTNGQYALTNAETGIENALLQLERDPNYSGETTTLPAGAVTTTVVGGSTKTITAVGTAGTHKRTITATANYAGGILSITGWQETP